MHGDIIKAIQQYRHKIPADIALTFENTRGHQDRETAYDDLPRIAQLNVQMESKAKSFLEAHIIKPDRIGDFFQRNVGGGQDRTIYCPHRRGASPQI